MLRFFGLLFGIPVLLLGTICVGGALASVIGGVLNKAPMWAFPAYAFYGLLFTWLGYRLVFTKPVKPTLPNLWKPKVSK
jgi:hypothetical protein